MRTAAASIAVAVFVTWGAPFVQTSEQQDTVARSLAGLSHRPTFARLSDAPHYRPYKTPARKRGDGRRFGRENAKVAADLTEGVFPDRVEQLHARGIARLLIHDHKEAIRFLGEAVALIETKPVGPERKAEILNDFSVAHRELAAADPKSLVVGLDAIQKAWALDRTPAIAWTRAILLSALASQQTARSAWDDYLALDSTSQWAREARARRRTSARQEPRAVRTRAIELDTKLEDGSVAIERYDRAFAELVRDGDRNGAASVLLRRAETLDAMHATEEAWVDRLRARKFASGLTADDVVQALGVAALRDGYVHAAHALFADVEQQAPASIVHVAMRTPVRNPAIEAMAAEDARITLNQEARLAAANGEVASALWMSDRARTIGRPAGESSRCASDVDGRNLEELGRALVRCVPKGVTLVYQDLASDELRTWVIRDGAITFTTFPVSSARLVAEIERYRDDVHRATKSEALREQGVHLYDILLRPVEQQIARDGLLVYSPSPNLRDVPLNVLHDGEGFLLERRPVIATATVSAFDLPRAAASTAEALVVLPPVAPKGTWLTGSEREVRAVKRLYGPRATLLAGDVATPEAFLRSAAQYGIIHVATHGQTSNVPWQNAIEFGERRIRAYDVFRLRLERAPVVMLAACNTADETGGPYNVSLAGAFLAAGASSVVGTLWEVDDDQTVALSTSFHRQLARGVPPHEALRNAQLQAIRAGMPASTWAAFQINS